MPTRTENEAKVMSWAMTLRPTVTEIVAAGATRPTDVARELNRRGVTTLRGGVWTHVQVAMLARRLGVVLKSSRAETEEKAMAHAMELQPLVAEIMAEGTTNPTGVAKELNLRGVPTLRGGLWGPSQALVLLQRISWGTAPEEKP